MSSKLIRFLLCVALCVACWIGSSPILQPAYATLTDDHFDGNIFALYGGNGSLVPPRVSLFQSLQLDRPALLVFYVDDSHDCKRYTPVLNEVQAFYGKSVSIIPVLVDTLDLSKSTYQPTEEAGYYRGMVPQTVLINTDGKVLLDSEGNTDFETIEAALKQIPGLPSPPANLRLRNAKTKQINEINP